MSVIADIIHWRPPVKAVIFATIFSMLLMLSGTAHFFRIYENALIRQTESELIAQGAAITTAYKFSVLRLFDENKSNIDIITDYGVPVTSVAQESAISLSSALDITTSILYPPRPDSIEELRVADDISYAAGETLTPFIAEIQRTMLSGIVVLDYNGIVIASTNDELGRSLIDVPEVEEALQGRPKSVLRKRELSKLLLPTTWLVQSMGVRVFVAMPVIMDDKVIGAVLLSRTPRNIMGLLYEHRGALLLLVFGCVGLVTLIFFFAFYSIAQPMTLLAQQVHTLLTRGGGQVLVKHPITEEVTNISNDLAKIGEQVERRSRYIRDFALYVSEAFRPLLLSVIDMAENAGKDDEATRAKKYNHLKKISEDGRRLEYLLERMKELADADLMLPTQENSNLKHILRDVTEKYNEKGLIISCKDMPEDNIITQIASDALITVFSHLCDNGLQHGANTVEVTVRLTEENVELMFVDNGTGISFEDAPKIFIPFFTTHQEEGGVGLGLALVYRLLEVHNGSIRPVPSDRGAIFIIALPRVGEVAE